MAPKICLACKRPLFEQGVANRLPWLKRRIYEAVAKAGDAGITKWQIANTVYAGARRPGIDVVKVHISHLNSRHLKKRGLRIDGFNRESESGEGLYRLVATGEAQGGGQP